MKKIIKKICLAIGKVLKLIDKIIITPIMKLFLKIVELFGKNDKSFEKVFSSKQALIIISLILAFATYYAIDKNMTTLVDNSADILYNQSVKAIYNEEAYVIEGLPKSVDVILIGRKSDIYLAKQNPSNEGISVDLRELIPGTHKVNLKYRQTVESLDYKIDPSTVTVVVYDKVSSTRELTSEVLNRNKLDSKLDISDITLGQTEVTVKGSSKKLETVAYVKALVDIDNLVEPTIGEVSIANNKLVAYNDAGEKVDVEILPDTVDATIKITSTSKVVPIKVVPIGDIALGYAIKSATPNVANVTIFGDEELLKSVEYLPVKVDITNLSSNKEYNVNLEKPSGVREMSKKTVNVKIEVAKEEQKEIENVTIQTVNLASDLKVTALSKESSAITVIIKGSRELLDSIDPSKIRATIDLSEYTKPGEYEVNVKVSGDDLRLSYTSKTQKVKIEIYK